MTIYYDHDESAIIENHPDYVEFDDDGRLVIHVDEMDREEKFKSWLHATEDALDDSDAFDLVEDATVEWVPRDER